MLSHHNLLIKPVSAVVLMKFDAEKCMFGQVADCNELLPATMGKHLRQLCNIFVM